VLLARYIPFFTRLITVVSSRSTAVGAAAALVIAFVATFLVVFAPFALAFDVVAVGWSSFRLLFLGVKRAQHLGRLGVDLGLALGVGRAARQAFSRRLHALLVVLALQVGVEMDGRRGDKIADLAAHVRTLAFDFFDGFQHASVFFCPACASRRRPAS